MVRKVGFLCLFLSFGLLLVSALATLWAVVSELLGGEWTDIPLVMGLGACAIVPSALLFFTARSVVRRGPSLSAAIMAIGFSVPLLATALSLRVWSEISPLYLNLALGFGALILVWGAHILILHVKTRS